MHSEPRRATVPRLYVLTFWLFLALALLVPGYHVIAYVHDRIVVGQDFDCFRQELARELAGERARSDRKGRAIDVLWSSEAAEKCNVRLVEGDLTSLATYSTRAWELELMWRPPNPLATQFVRRAVFRSVLALLPLAALLLLRPRPR
ncbi:MAG TPA: hypothetical protein VMT17_03190 [Anaeromyxobacteraceae bacterium]|nr:hypothetical protein [Anaeromyxobacteraceae bacterium]